MAARGPRRVLVAFDKFKGALTAAQACDIAQRVIEREQPGWQVDSAPISDGGDGFTRLLTQAAGGRLIPCCVRPVSGGAAPEQVVARVGCLLGSQLPPAAAELLDLSAQARLLVADLASVDGLALRDRARHDLWQCTTRGTGELLAFCAEQGADRILLGVGGSATSDLGLGALGALGLGFASRRGLPIENPTPERFAEIGSLAGRARALPAVSVACDVDSPLLGPRGAAAVFGPQKGLASADLPRLELGAERLSRMLCEHLGQPLGMREQPGAGAAGGIGFGLMVAVGARLVSGFELAERWLRLRERVASVDFVLTGEGRFDESSFCGKGPGRLLRLAEEQGAPCVVLAGNIEADPRPGARYFALSPPELPLAEALEQSPERLAQATRRWLEQVTRSR